MKYANFYWISIASYILVTILNGNYIKTRCRVGLTYAMCMDDFETWGKRPLLAYSKSAGGWYKLLQNYLKPVIIHKSMHLWPTSWGCAQSKEAIQDNWLVDNPTVSAFEAYAIVTKIQAVQVGTIEQSIRRACDQALVWILL